MQDVYAADFARPGTVLQLGVPPVRIDILTELTGIQCGDAWPDRDKGSFGDLEVNFTGRDAFIANKRATARTRDLADIEGL